MSRTVCQNNFKGWNAQFHPLKPTVSSYETHSFILWNAQFHPLKLTVSPYETHSFILWNARFQCLKLCGCPFPPHHAPVGGKCAAGKSGAGKFSNVYGISGNNVTAGQIGEYQSEIIKAQKYKVIQIQI